MVKMTRDIKNVELTLIKPKRAELRTDSLPFLAKGTGTSTVNNSEEACTYTINKNTLINYNIIKNNHKQVNIIKGMNWFCPNSG